MERAESVAQMLHAEQKRFVAEFTTYDGRGDFAVREWTRPGLGGGRACQLEDGRVFERAGVNVSLVHGEQVPRVISDSHPGTRDMPFAATGLSMVLHPRNPYAPSFHANFRFFGIGDTEWWFGGGCDLTPCYGFDEDVVGFHRTLKTWLDRHDQTWYPDWKAACDEYFTIHHRGEMRGVGGVFFDNLHSGGFERCLRVVSEGLSVIMPAYLPILDRRCGMPYGERERNWQLVRRGRYVEFNLVYDRGTLFGLQTRGNIEAILMSMPPMVRWGSAADPEPGSQEGELARFLQPRDWITGPPR